MASFSFQTLYALALALLFTVANGAAVDANKRSPQVIKLDFTVEQTHQNFTTIDKRDSPVNVDLKNLRASYVADVYLGSNKQKNTVIVDTGSSDLWVDDSSANGNYDHTTSKTYKVVSPGFRVDYGTSTQHTYAQGNWVKDSVALGPNGPSVDLQFGDVTNTDIDQKGILGIGYTSLESAQQKYPNFPQALADAGIISKNAYSLYLNSPDASTGSLLFGGIDHAKIDGNLATLPSVGDSSRLDVQVDSASFNGQTVDIGIPANLDSGTTLSLFPDAFAKAFAQAAFGSANSNAGLYFSLGNCPSTAPDVTFNFKGVSITVPGTELLLQEPFVCVSGIESSEEIAILGDNFLRRAYVVYDLQDHQISLGKVKYTSESDITVIS